MTPRHTPLEKIVGAFAMTAWTIRRSFEFTGRSRRTEVICYWGVTMLATALIVLPTKDLLAFEQANAVEVIVQGLVAVPFFALFARRFHDMGYSGWIALLVFPAVVLSLHKAYWYRFTPPDIMIQGYPYGGAIGMIALPGVIIGFWALIHEGQDGSNRYGPDPRLETGEKAVA